MDKNRPLVYTGNMSETIRISERVYLRKGNLPVRDQCNTGIIVGNEGLLLVDLPEQFPEEEILEEAESYFGRKVTHLLFTHAHGDHRKGLASIKRKDLILISGKAAYSEIRKCYPGFQAAQWLTPDSEDELVLDGIRFRFWIPDKLPAHSPWDMSIVLPEENLVFTGDFVVPPFYMYNYSGDWENWVKGLTDFQQVYEENLLLMGHGDPVKGVELLTMLTGYLTELGECAENQTEEKVQRLSKISDRNTVLRQLREIHESQGKS